VLDEVMDASFPFIIHIGGDEAVKEQWKRSKKINRLLQQLNLKDETGLQGYFTKRIDEYVRSKGRNIIGWDEILEGDIPKEAAVMSWRGTQGGIEAARAGPRSDDTNSYCYFDFYQSKDTTEQLAIGGFIPVEKVYYMTRFQQN
jgi:hexosaminidase